MDKLIYKALKSAPTLLGRLTLLTLALGQAAMADGTPSLQFDLTQSGIAGATGHRWVLYGTGRLERFSLAPGGRAALEQGWQPSKAQSQQLQRLVKTLCTPQLPTRLGAEPQINPLTLSLNGHGCRTTMHLPAGSSLEANVLGPHAPAAARQLLELARLLGQAQPGQ